MILAWRSQHDSHNISTQLYLFTISREQGVLLRKAKSAVQVYLLKDVEYSDRNSRSSSQAQEEGVLLCETVKG